MESLDEVEVLFNNYILIQVDQLVWTFFLLSIILIRWASNFPHIFTLEKMIEDKVELEGLS